PGPVVKNADETAVLLEGYFNTPNLMPESLRGVKESNCCELEPVRHKFRIGVPVPLVAIPPMPFNFKRNETYNVPLVWLAQAPSLVRVPSRLELPPLTLTRFPVELCNPP